MFSRRLQLAFFIASLQHHYRARLTYMVFPFITNQIVQLLTCLKQERIIAGFFVIKPTKAKVYHRLYVYFYYINNNGLLFQHFRFITPRICLSHVQIRRWLHQKISLISPILFIETPTHGIVTDRQLVYLQIHQHIPTYLGGRLIARLDC